MTPQGPHNCSEPSPLKGAACEDSALRPVQYVAFVQAGILIDPPGTPRYGTEVISPPWSANLYRYEEIGSRVNQERAIFAGLVAVLRHAAVFP